MSIFLRLVISGRTSIIVGSAVLLASCAAFTPVDVAKPSQLTLPEATRQVGQSLVALKRELEANNLQAGLLIDEVEVHLNVTANATQGGTQKLTVDVAKTALAGVGLNAEVTGNQSSTGNRENNITLKFKNIYTATLNKPGTTHIAAGKDRVVIFNAD